MRFRQAEAFADEHFATLLPRLQRGHDAAMQSTLFLDCRLLIYAYG